VITLRLEKKAAYALKLTELARVLDVWAKAITPKTAEPVEPVPEAVQPPCEADAGVNSASNPAA
jgi:hypothetical protein